MQGKEYKTASGKIVKKLKEMEFAVCKCSNKCAENVSLESRQEIYNEYRENHIYEQRRQYVFDRLG